MASCVEIRARDCPQCPPRGLHSLSCIPRTWCEELVEPSRRNRRWFAYSAALNTILYLRVLLIQHANFGISQPRSSCGSLVHVPGSDVAASRKMIARNVYPKSERQVGGCRYSCRDTAAERAEYFQSNRRFCSWQVHLKAGKC